jgi:general stress protein 26
MLGRSRVTVMLVVITAGCQRSAPASGAPAAEAPAGATRTGAVTALVASAELNRAANPSAVVDSARKLMLADSNDALVTVDSSGQPRVRTVRAFVDPPDATSPERGLTVWIMTRLSTRKVEQIRRHPLVTLYFNDDDKFSYATIMGSAIVHTDPEHPRAKRHYEVPVGADGPSSYAKFFWPDFPRDFVMIEVRPRWLEYMGPGVGNNRENWRPQAVEFTP